MATREYHRRMQPNQTRAYGKPFQWSWTRLKNYRVCPKRHYHVDIAKEFSDDNDASRWGKTFHETMAKTINGAPLPPSFKHHADIVGQIMHHKQRGLDVSVELQLAMTEDFKPSPWFGADTWFRAVIDVQVLDETKAVAFDWKTGGKIQPDMEQLGLTAQMLFVHHPKLEEVSAMYWWTQHHEDTTKTYRRTDMTALWAGLMPEVKAMEEAAKTLTYPPKPSGLCVKHCPVTSCPHHGRGSF